MPRVNKTQWDNEDIAPFGFLDGHGVWFLPIHQPVEPHDFVTDAHLICSLCSYTQENGQPRKVVEWPCAKGSIAGPTMRSKKRLIPRNVTGLLPSRAPYSGLYQPLTLTPAHSSSPSTSVFCYAISLLRPGVLKKIGLWQS